MLRQLFLILSLAVPTLATAQQAASRNKARLRLLIVDENGGPIREPLRLSLQDAAGRRRLQSLAYTGAAAGQEFTLDTGACRLVVEAAPYSYRALRLAAGSNPEVRIPLRRGVLRFESDGLRNDGLKGLEARIWRSDRPLDTFRQRCDSQQSYGPGRYRVVLNTLPPTRLNADLRFDATTTLLVDLPGRVDFRDAQAVDSVFISYPGRNNRREPFYEWNSGSGRALPAGLALKPGRYEIRFTRPGSEKPIVAPLTVEADGRHDFSFPAEQPQEAQR